MKNKKKEVETLTHQCPGCLEFIQPIELPIPPHEKRKYQYKCRECGYQYNQRDLEKNDSNLILTIEKEMRIICFDCEILMKHMSIRSLLKQKLNPFDKYFECPKCHSKIIIREKN